MKLVNTTLYHFRDGRRKNNNWVVGNKFSVDEDYRNYICSGIEPIDTNTPLINKKIEYYSMANDINFAFTKAEKMLELRRSEKYPELISRFNCMYFCDIESLEYWSHKLPDHYELYEVILNGEAFKSSTLLFPFASNNCTYEDFLKLCDDYWNPNMTEELNSYNEYLFQGSVFVSEKLDANKVRSRNNN
ncbi:MAG: hypothetical protein IKX00_02975 [Bacilli bacterium]|nr:hypothetical protein [Bacilli bacterium]